MSSDSIKPVIFISYAHADEPERPRDEEIQWLSFVMKFLRPAVKYGEFRIWVDPQIPAGTPWDPEIEHHLEACSVFLLLVSANSMASDYIIDKELAIARERQATGAMQIYPLLIEATPKAGLARVRDLNVRPPGLKPLQSYPLADRNQHMSDAADEIADMATAMAEKAATAARKVELPDLLIPEIAGIVPSMPRRRGVAGPAAPDELRPRGPAILDIGGLPETGYERLVGRDDELKRLDDAWSNDKTNILSLVAEGGAGKSALVNEWLTRLRAESYRGATIVLGWSFFSQGSEKRATSADEFLNWALAKLGVTIETTSASAKGEAIAEALVKRRALLVLDGVEPLQHGPSPQAGQLKDQGLRALLRRFAAAPPSADHSLIVMTSRVAVADIQRFKGGSAAVIDVEKLSEEAGAELLRDNDVWGIDADLRSASRDFAGHPLALTLLASYLKETQNGDVRRRDHLRGLLADADNPRHDQARRVMESYEKEWLAGQPVLLAILHIVGLFDRPASGECLKALRAKPPIRGLTDKIVKLDDSAWRRNVARLREVRLLAPLDPSDPDALDSHPLVREWFGDRMRQTVETAWKAAHSRLYDHLRDTTHEGQAPTLADLAPLYHAIAHGCRSGRHQEALDEVYLSRICRRYPNGDIEFYAGKKLGAVGSDLAAMSWFFDPPYETPVASLTPPGRAWVLNVASLSLRAQGRLLEALASTRAGLQMEEAGKDWRNASSSASNLSETELLVGDITSAAAAARKSVTLADRSGHAFNKILCRTTHGGALHAAGEWENAANQFVDAERREKERGFASSLVSFQGYLYCDLLLSRGQAGEARGRAARALEVARKNKLVLDVAVSTLTLGRSDLALALAGPASNVSAEVAREDARTSGHRLYEGTQGLRASGRNDYLPCGLIARAAFRRTVGDWAGAGRDLDEAREIAELGPMRLHLCDIALERARLALAQIEAFAPLNGLVEPSPPLPSPPDAAAAAELRETARSELDIARKLIADCGYHRRDEELAELDDVVAGGRRFADLPPRV
jgi:hypothetical protein